MRDEWQCSLVVVPLRDAVVLAEDTAVQSLCCSSETTDKFLADVHHQAASKHGSVGSEHSAVNPADLCLHANNVAKVVHNAVTHLCFMPALSCVLAVADKRGQVRFCHQYGCVGVLRCIGTQMQVQHTATMHQPTPTPSLWYLRVMLHRQAKASSAWYTK